MNHILLKLAKITTGFTNPCFIFKRRFKHASFSPFSGFSDGKQGASLTKKEMPLVTVIMFNFMTKKKNNGVQRQN